MSVATQTRTKAEYALAYASKGWHVFPCYWIENGACACGDVSCKSPGKHPIGALVPRGHIDASIAPQRISSWWRQYPNANIAVYLGASGLVAIDIDPRNGGDLTIETLEGQYGPLLSEVEAITGGGGRHLVFSAPSDLGGLPGKLGPGVDVKLNGYIVVEPSVHLSGQEYAWEASSDPLQGAVPSPLPDWLRGYAAPPVQSQTVGQQVIAPQTVHELRSALASMRSDDRDLWVANGHALKALGDVGRGLWLEWSQTSSKYDARDAAEKWESFQPSATDYRAVFSKALSGGWVAPQYSGPGLPAGSDLLLDVQQLSARYKAMSWAVKGIIPASSIGIIFGASGTFKSFIALDYALHRAYGFPWLGRKTKQGIPVYIAAEGGAGLMRRIEAWHKLRGMDWTQCPMRVVIVPLSLAQQASALRAAIDEIGLVPSDIIVDTLSQTFDGDENENKAIAAFLRTLGTELREPYGSTVLVVHHVGHAATERPRGASALIANSDFLFGVFRDESAMLATFECVKQKDSERPETTVFDMRTVALGSDEDGEPITSLVATQVNPGAELLAATRRTRAGLMGALLDAIGHGAPEKTVRESMYRAMQDKAPDQRRVAFWRTLKQAKAQGIVVQQGDWLQCAVQQIMENGDD